MKKLFQSKYVFLGLVVLAVVVYIGASFAIGHRPNPQSLDMDEQDYYSISTQLLEGTYEFNPRRPLGYPFLLVCLRWLTFDNFQALQVLAAALFSLSGPLVYLVVKKVIKHDLVAVTSAIMVIFWPNFIFYGRTLYSEVLALPFFISFLLVLPNGSLVEGERKPWLGRTFWAGILLGLCMLLRPMYLIFAPFAVLIVFLEEWDFSTAWRRALCLTLGCCLLVLPWSFAISSQAGKFILVSSNGGETISGGLNPVLASDEYPVFRKTPDGRTVWVGPGKWLPMHASGYLSEAELSLSHAEKDQLLRQRAAAWIAQNPAKALSLQTAKLAYMWGFYPLFIDGWKKAVFGNFLIMGAGVLSLLTLLRFKTSLRQLSRFWVLPLFVSAVALISWGSWRFRQPGDLGLLVLASLLFWSLVLGFQRLGFPRAQIDGGPMPKVLEPPYRGV